MKVRHSDANVTQVTKALEHTVEILMNAKLMNAKKNNTALIILAALTVLASVAIDLLMIMIPTIKCALISTNVRLAKITVALGRTALTLMAVLSVNAKRVISKHHMDIALTSMNVILVMHVHQHTNATTLSAHMNAFVPLAMNLIPLQEIVSILMSVMKSHVMAIENV